MQALKLEKEDPRNYSSVQESSTTTSKPSGGAAMCLCHCKRNRKMEE